VRPFLSICIPSYNRPEDLRRLIDSIDASNADDVEIVIREDKSPKREEIRTQVKDFSSKSRYFVNYIENESNFGYDKNIRSVANAASGEWIIFMGDDDAFIPTQLDKYIDFLKRHNQLGYVLRRYKNVYNDGTEEEYRYSNSDMFLDSGEDAAVEFFRRSVFISGFTFKKDLFTNYNESKFDGSLLFQLYIQASICLFHPSAYCDIPITMAIEGGTPFFGSSESEKHLYESGSNTFNNSINFLKQVRFVTESIDSEYNVNLTSKILKEYSKYSYGYLHEHRDDGVKIFKAYAKEIKKIGLGDSPLFNVYYVALLILGKKNCQRCIQMIKKILGKTPKL